MIPAYGLYFFIYAFFGWCVEVIHAALKTGKFVNRGFLNGCMCPIYGVGVVLILLCLTPINRNVFVLFFASVALTTLLEFITGFLLEKIFHTKWWDYSGEHFHIKGYVCVKFSLLWGLACIIVVDLVHPFIAFAVGKLPDIALYIVLGTCAAAFVVDLVFTLIQLITHEKNYKTLEQICAKLKIPSDAIGGKISCLTLDMEEKVKAAREKLRASRLYKAFPGQIRKSKRWQDAEAVADLPPCEKMPDEPTDGKGA